MPTGVDFSAESPISAPSATITLSSFIQELAEIPPPDQRSCMDDDLRVSLRRRSSPTGREESRSAYLGQSEVRTAQSSPFTEQLDNTRAFAGTNPTDESIVSDLPVVRQLFENPMRCTLLRQRLPYLEVSGDSCRLWPPS